MRKNEFSEMPDVVVVMEPGKKLSGMRFSITGHLGTPRGKIVQMIEELGGRFDERPVWGTKYLLTNKDWTAQKTSLKFQKAMDLGIKIITESEFYALIGRED